ncbi:alpha/beta fold hydrolase [Mycobacterium sp. E2733]|uniref:alpha/beta fold hydrolase n=1 Tax=Mycobacterium sp. E2733 TaxID=1834138 RepID=UPI0007FF95FF|nr:alpha/beta hydrolase [Mycobacterium sp. E2733]OBH90192.1 alpha/beta hydrolase [Mycobacterium sp. E2733]
MSGLAPVGHLPPGRVVELPGRGSTYVVDSGPVADAPTFLLLHGAATTGLMMWYPALEMMREFGRVVVFDQRWHGQGISSPRFLLEDCADDVAALADALGVDTFVPVGYSMGSLVAQLVWYRHRERLDGLVLGAAATGWWNGVAWERLGAGVLAALIEAFSPRPGVSAAAAPSAESSVGNDLQWMLGQVRSTSLGGIARAVAEITRFDSTSWVGTIDVPTVVLIPLRDRTIPPRQQFWLANQIPEAQVVTVDGGHTCCALQYDKFVAALHEAVDSVRRRIAPEAGKIATLSLGVSR